VVLDSRYGRLFGVDAIGELLLRQAGSFTGLAENFPDFELLVAFVESFGEPFVFLLPLLDVAVKVALGLLPPHEILLVTFGSLYLVSGRLLALF